MNNYTASSVRNLIDKYFSLQWCRDNLVVPIQVEPSLPPNKQVLKIAIANFQYLGTVGNTIKERINDMECQFIERSPDKINEILDLAAEEKLISGENIEISEFSEDAVIAALKETSEVDDSEFSLDFEDFLEEDIEDDTTDLTDEMLGSKTQKAAGTVLIHACKTDVSDIHIEPKEDTYKIRVRRDGVLQKFITMPTLAGKQLIACLKNMANMDIAEKRASQDGKILRRFEGNRLEFRCSTAPGKHGEGMVLRILNSTTEMLNLDTLINVKNVRDKFRESIQANNGIVIVSGPTGSGKSTTLASALREIDNGELKIVTAEDPIEYDLGGDIVQHQVNRAKDQTFATFLRTFMRQDPDVILIGETRDPETAESSMDAAETGHLVFTTLHANTSSSSLTRLLDMEVPKYKINSSVRAILAQRLLRRVCTCSIERQITEEESKIFRIRPGTKVRQANVLTEAEKQKRKSEKTLCQKCNGVGYKGRVGTYELLLINKKIQNEISANRSDREIQESAVESNGMLTLRAYALELVKMGLTTLNELNKVS